MKKIFIFLCLSLLVLGGCGRTGTDSDRKGAGNDRKGAEGSWLSDVKFEENSNDVQGNLIVGSTELEKDGLIVFQENVFNEGSNKLETLCKDPICNHSGNINCIQLQGLGNFVEYNSEILCTVGTESRLSTDVIYALDPKAGTLSERFDAKMPVSGFRMTGDKIALVQSGDRFYIVDFETGRKQIILRGKEFASSFYSLDSRFLYIVSDNHSLHRVSLDGTEDKVIAEKASWPVACGGFLYYGSWTDESWSVRRMDESGKDTLVGEDMFTFTVYGEYIYYNTASYPHKVMMCDLDGENRKEIMEGQAGFTVLTESSRVLLAKDGPEYMVMNLDGSDLHKLY